MSLCASSASSPQLRDLPSSTLGHPSFRYYVVTSTLSSIAEDTASYSASIDGGETKSPVPWCEHLYRSAVSPDCRLSAFLTDQGRLKLASLVSSNGDHVLRMRDISNRKFQARKEAEANHAGIIGICPDPQGFVVTLVDRFGSVAQVCVVEAQKNPSILNGQPDSSSKSPSKKGFSVTGAAFVSELSDHNLPIRELAASNRLTYRR